MDGHLLGVQVGADVAVLGLRAFMVFILDGQVSERTALRRKNSLLVEATLWPGSAQG